jgi:hypothetical protein
MSPLRLTTLRFGAALLLGSSLTLAAALAESATPSPPDGSFRVSRGLVAPWVERAATPPEHTSWIGQTVTFTPSRFATPAFPACDHVRYDTGMRPPEGLFQGGLPAPAAAAAASLALTDAMIASVTIACDDGLFDLHWATPDALLLALDNVIWVLDRSPGALAAAATPEHVVQGLLERHFAGDMGFDPATVARLAPFLGLSLQRAIADYFAQPWPADEPPPINGDPITDSQDLPVLFSVREASQSSDRVVVPVRYDDGYRRREVRFVLVRDADGWRVDDLQYEYGGSLRDALRPVR